MSKIFRKLKKIEFCQNINPGFSVSDNLFFIISEIDWVLATVSEKWFIF